MFLSRLPMCAFNKLNSPDREAPKPHRETHEDFINSFSSSQLLDAMGAKLDMLLFNTEPNECYLGIPSPLHQEGNCPIMEPDYEDEDEDDMVNDITTQVSQYQDCNSLPPLLQTDEPKPSMHFVDVGLFHKPRGSRGVWQPVTANERLRVTKNKGKRLKLRSMSKYKFDPKKVDIFTVDIAHPLPSKEGITIESIAVTEQGLYILEVELKLFASLKQFQFSIHTLSEDGKMRLVGNTVIFTTSNSGGTKQNPTKKRKLSEAKSEGSDFRNTPLCHETPAVVPSSLDVYGFVRAKAFHQMSDVRLKTNIDKIVGALGTINKLKGRTYQWRDQEHLSGDKKVLGMIAQEVEQVLPQVVFKDPKTGLLSVNYVEMVPLLIEALKEHVQAEQKAKEQTHRHIMELNKTIFDLKNLKPNTMTRFFWVGMVLLFCWCFVLSVPYIFS